MVSVQKINREKFHLVYPLVAELNPSFAEADWNKALDCRWNQLEDYSGYGLFDGEELVGFLGLIFSQRIIDDNTEKFANLHSWIVKPEYRNHSLSLIVPLFRLKNYTFTNTSPTVKVVEIMQKLGFQQLDFQLKLLLPINLFNRTIQNKNIKCITDTNEIAKCLDGEELNLFQDHSKYSECQHLLAKHNHNYCYILYTKVNNSRFSYCYIHHISDRTLFARHHYLIRTKICQMTKTPWIIVDSRMIKSIHVPFCYTLPFSFPKLYKSSSLKPEQIDNLYSELPLLNFNLLPTNLEGLKYLWQYSQNYRSLKSNF